MANIWHYLILAVPAKHAFAGESIDAWFVDALSGPVGGGLGGSALTFLSLWAYKFIVHKDTIAAAEKERKALEDEKFSLLYKEQVQASFQRLEAQINENKTIIDKQQEIISRQQIEIEQVKQGRRSEQEENMRMKAELSILKITIEKYEKYQEQIIIATNEQTIITSIKGECQSITGYPPDELIGQHIDLLIPIDRRLHHQHAVDARIGTTESFFNKVIPFAQLIHKNAHYVNISLATSGVYSKDGWIFEAVIRRSMMTEI